MSHNFSGVYEYGKRAMYKGQQYIIVGPVVSNPDLRPLVENAYYGIKIGSVTHTLEDGIPDGLLLPEYSETIESGDGGLDIHIHEVDLTHNHVSGEITFSEEDTKHRHRIPNDPPIVYLLVNPTFI